MKFLHIIRVTVGALACIAPSVVFAFSARYPAVSDWNLFTSLIAAPGITAATMLLGPSRLAQRLVNLAFVWGLVFVQFCALVLIHLFYFEP